MVTVIGESRDLQCTTPCSETTVIQKVFAVNRLDSVMKTTEEHAVKCVHFLSLSVSLGKILSSSEKLLSLFSENKDQVICLRILGVSRHTNEKEQELSEVYEFFSFASLTWKDTLGIDVVITQGLTLRLVEVSRVMISLLLSELQLFYLHLVVCWRK